MVFLIRLRNVITKLCVKRSRHSSGASIGKGRSQTTPQDLRKKSGSAIESPDVGQKKTQDEDIMELLRTECRQQYIQYLRTIGFTPLHTLRPSPNEKYNVLYYFV